MESELQRKQRGGEGEFESYEYSDTAPRSDKDKKLRACLNCKMVKTFEQFYEEGCHNCPDLHLRSDKQRIEDSTTALFTGLMSIINPKAWIARYTNVADRVPGCYAVNVTGELSEAVRDDLRDAGMGYDDDED
eukprot:TRINITY_DN115139_c0_g1_i1.p1 TRINITY_DN115139_c0_g1~~TRINITY_DN115139_c0_g1_i1.p1  ORF type:complete len:133 (+),score=18.19 TRINITY_DN115139_c0_g1_i1:79-477(+)